MRSRPLFVFSFILVACFLSLVSLTSAQVFSSQDFQVNDPVVMPGGYGSSQDFQLFGVITQLGIGTSSISSFNVNAGFLYFPFVSTPAVSATAGDAQVALTWSASTGFLGWSVSGYDVGRSTTSGGPYTYTFVGDTLAYTATSLTNGTPYYFVVRPLDAFSNAIATSTEVSATPAAATPPPPPPPPGGGGGGGGLPGGKATVIFRGKAYPRSQVILLKDAVLTNSTFAGADANFEIVLGNLNSGSYVFGIYADDYQGRRSPIFTFPMFLAESSQNTVSGIFLAPTIDVDHSEVKKGDDIGILGQSAPFADLTISVHSNPEMFVKTKTDKDGIYLYYFDTSPLDLGDHVTKSKSAVEGLVSGFGSLIGFKVGDENIGKVPVPKCPQKGDVNNDCRVNLVDFSITAYWWQRPLTQKAKDTIDAKLYVDGVITLRDFSIMAYYWTG